MAWADVGKDDGHLSATQLSMYLRCPAQYEFRYVKGIKRPPNSALVLGGSVHVGIEHNMGVKFATKKAAPVGDVLDAFATAFEEKKADAEFTEDPGAVKDRGVGMTRLHYESVAPSITPVEKPELEVRYNLPGVKRAILGFIDILGDVVRMKRVIVDTKTTGRKKNQFDVDLDLQLTSYAAWHQTKHAKAPGGLMFDVLVGNSKGIEHQRIITSRSKEQLAQFPKTVAMIEQGIDAGVFPPMCDGSVCSWCGYGDICKAASAAVKARKP